LLLWAGIALLQTLALPGYLCTRLLRLDEDSWIQTAACSFGLSLLLNHIVVVLLVLAGAFTQGVRAACRPG
jgi:uncharacterized membrane protein